MKYFFPYKKSRRNRKGVVQPPPKEFYKDITFPCIVCVSPHRNLYFNFGLIGIGSSGACRKENASVIPDSDILSLVLEICAGYRGFTTTRIECEGEEEIDFQI